MLKHFSTLRSFGDHRYERYLPSAFNESMSLVQRVNQIIVHLNETVERVNDLSELTVNEINRLIEAFENLKTWVEDYGIKETTVSVLTEWLNDGTLAEIITDDLFVDFVRRHEFDELVETIHEMMENFKGGYDIDLKTDEVKGDGVTVDSVSLQKALDDLPDNSTAILPPFTYIVEKNEQLTGFPNNDQPALLIRNKKNVRIIAYGAVLKTNTHAQGILEIQQSEHITIEGITFEGLGDFPHLDATGYGEKGNPNGGYATSGFWGYYKNNSFDTSERTTRKSGDTSNAKWGTFRNGYIGNVSFGLLVHNKCNHITIKNSYARKFNYAGFGVGFNGDYHPTNLSYDDSKNVTFENCYSSDNYDTNFHVMACDGVSVINCKSIDSGHPNATLSHTFVDPGYGITARGSEFSKVKNLLVSSSYFDGNKRKGIDAHSGHGVRIVNNKVKNSWVDGIFTRWTTVNQFTKDIIIIGNEIEECAIHSNSGASISLGALRSDYSKQNIELNAIVTSNICNYTGGANIIDVSTFDMLIMENNIVNGVSPRNSRNSIYGIKIGSGTSSERSYMLMLKGNVVDAKGGNRLVRGINVGNVDDGDVSNNTIKILHGSANIGINTTNNGNVNFIGNVAILGDVGRPIGISQTDGIVANNLAIGGNEENHQFGNGVVVPYTPIIPKNPVNGTMYQDRDTGRLKLYQNTSFGEMRRVIHFRLVANGGNGTPNFYGGEEYVEKIEASTHGFIVTLKNIPSSVTPFMCADISGGNGLSGGGTTIGYVYPRGLGYGTCTVGLKQSTTSNHTRFDTLTDGSIDVMIMF